jgi:DNA-binding winged helix-turn-helix (wHTH) protein
MKYKFGQFELDTLAYKLRKCGEELPLQPQVFDVLLYLTERAGQVVSKRELIGAIWKEQHVGDASVTWSISHARRVLGQGRTAKTPIETVHGRGYRLSARVSVEHDEPVDTFQLGERLASESAAPTLGIRASLPFVGRDELMVRLSDKLSEARTGRGKLALLVGGAGMGKTRCTEELAALARAGGVLVLAARSVEGVGAPVFWPWQQVLRELVQEREAWRSAANLLLALFPGAGIPEAASALRGQFFEDLTRLLTRVGRAEPILLIFDDLHCADVGTLELLAFAAQDLARNGVMVLATLRDESNASNLRALSHLRSRADSFAMHSFSAADVSAYVRIAADEQAAASPELCAALLEQTAGIPLFVEETVRSIMARAGSASLHELPPEALQPSDLARDVLRVSLHALEPATRSLLSAASVLGEVFELSLLAQVAAIELATILERLDPAVAQRFVVAETPNRYRFRHALFRTVLYDDLRSSERLALHRCAADALSRAIDREQRASEIATHYYKALIIGDAQVVVDAADDAARGAERLYAYEDAARFYGWALEAQALLPAVSSRARTELLLRCASAERNAGRDDDARRTLETAVALGCKGEHGDLLVRAARMLRPTYVLSTMIDGVVQTALERALRSAPEGAHPQRISALSQLACLPPIACDLEQSKRTSALALQLARDRLAELSNTSNAEEPARAALTDSLYEALRARVYSLSGPDDIDALLTLCDEMLSLADPPWEVRWEAHTARLGALIYRGDVERASVVLETMKRSAAEVKRPEQRWYCARQDAQLELMHGDFAHAAQSIHDLRCHGRRMRLGYGKVFTKVLDTALDYWRDGPHVVKVHKDLLGAIWSEHWPSTVRSYGVRLAAEAGEMDAARRNWHVLAKHRFEDIPKELSYLMTLCNCAITATLLDDRRSAETLYQLLSPYPHHNTPDLLLMQQGSVSHFLAILANTTGRDESVEQHFEAALAMNERIGLRTQLARTCYEYARWMCAREDAAERERGRQLAGRAAELSSQIGLHWLSHSASALY